MGVPILFSLIYFQIFLVLVSSSQGYKFNVGGKDGWVLNPSESYNHWAQRNRFQVNDTLLFKFKKGNDSVLEVTLENYKNCNVKNLLKSLTNEEYVFKLERSGPHYFISGNEGHCQKGQKLVIVVLAIRLKKSPPTSTPTPALSHLPPLTFPTFTPSPTPIPTPSHSSPLISPAPSSLLPAPSSKAPSPSPKATDGPSSLKNLAVALQSTTLISTLIVSVTVGVVCFGAIF